LPDSVAQPHDLLLLHARKLKFVFKWSGIRVTQPYVGGGRLMNPVRSALTDQDGLLDSAVVGLLPIYARGPTVGMTAPRTGPKV
jgi:hypothetical protein